MDAADTLVRNEQAKLTATYLNGLAIGTFLVGGLAPLVGVASGQIRGPTGAIAALALFCIGVSGVVHGAARRVLRRLRV